MHYVARRSHRMQKHKFDITSPSKLFMETALGPPENDKCIVVLCPDRTGMHYVTHSSHRMQKHKFGITCLNALFMKTAPGPPGHEK
jgi:hypothetical protein